jgi:NAD+ kinase
LKRVGILFHPKKAEARSLTSEISSLLSKSGISCWESSAWEEQKAQTLAKGSDLVVSIGGDGTILRAARISSLWNVPVLGINMGRVGFLTELETNEVTDYLPQLIAGEGWIDERAMLSASLLTGTAGGKSYDGLNDVVIARRSSTRVVTVETRLNGEEFTAYRGDGVIVSTATGSTGYCLAAGGPILHPGSREIVLQPICPHLSQEHGMVLAEETGIELRVNTSTDAIFSVDGQLEVPLTNGDTVSVRLSERSAKLLRLHPRSHFYATLAGKLRGKS